ncbi:FAD-dependent oxidoreductase [Pseudonocardia sp. TRM90224]|uniref:FAD-dependent oxidoreductase n=1 Tax=Pseudonocardia sp. TRM90224 TaxID=2812678 RepID=UPI001E5E11FE|nr:FAD-dependent monooxygenase [Pseudonocardia sp. TRM90224]
MPVTHVVGAGIAGTAVALGLHANGAEVVVHEAGAEGDADAGAFLAVAENGMAALARLDADAAVRDASEPLRQLLLSAADGTEIASRPLGSADGPGYRYLTRAALCAVLCAEAQRRGIEIRYGERLSAAETTPEEVRLTFGSGAVATGELLVGADGVRSAVRTMIDPAAAPPRYVGHRVYYGYSDAVGEPVDRIHFVREAAATFGAIATEREGTWWFARAFGPALGRAELAAATTRSIVAELTELLSVGRLPSAIVSASRRALVTNAYDLANVRMWHRDRMIVIGDAAHAASPATGQGASMALEDAVALAEALRDGPDLATAFASYELARRERVEANTAASASM